MATSLFSGIAFGAALTASGVYHPAVILGQLKLADWDMLETFLTATASSTLLISTFHAAKFVKLAPRCYSSLGLFADYDGNMLGGMLLGTGMALAGSCPGTVLSQVGVGLGTGLPTLGGAILAGIVWTGFVRPRLHSSSTPPTCTQPPAAKTLHESLGITSYLAAAMLEAAVVALLTVVSARSSPSGSTALQALRPAAGGLLIGLAQLASLLLRRSAVGVSTAYEEAGDFLWWPLCAPDTEAPPAAKRPQGRSLIFAGGVIAGSWLLAAAMPAVLRIDVAVVPDIPVWQLVLGGFLMVMGARLAGGCTSGHGISGMSLLSVSSFVTIGSALAAGVVTAKTFL